MLSHKRISFGHQLFDIFLNLRDKPQTIPIFKKPSNFRLEIPKDPRERIRLHPGYRTAFFIRRTP